MEAHPLKGVFLCFYQGRKLGTTFGFTSKSGSSTCSNLVFLRCFSTDVVVVGGRLRKGPGCWNVEDFWKLHDMCIIRTKCAGLDEFA